MKVLKRILTIIVIVIVLAIAGGMIFLNSVKTRALGSSYRVPRFAGDSPYLCR